MVAPSRPSEKNLLITVVLVYAVRKMELADFEKRANLILENLKKELSGLRGGQPTPKLVEDLKADYFGQLVPIKQLGSISVAPPREIDIKVWDKNAVAAVVKAIENSGLGLTANTAGNLIRLNLPPLSEERRQEIIKLAKKTAEEFRIQLRHFRDECNKQINKKESGGEIDEDQKFKLKAEVQKITDKITGDIEKSLENKVKEIIA